MAGYDRPPRAGEHIIDWAVDTHRIAAASAPTWRSLLAAASGQQRQVLEATVRGLAQGLPPGTDTRLVTAAASGSDPAMALNPLVDELLSQPGGQQAYDDANSVNPAVPTLFEGGDLPAFTASGVDPAELLNVPWQFRHAIAAAPTRSEALMLIEQASDADTAIAFGFAAIAHPGNDSYQSRFTTWVLAGTEAARARQVAARRRNDQRRVAAAATDPSTATNAQVYDALFGEIDRQNQAVDDWSAQARAAGRTLAGDRYRRRYIPRTPA